MSYIMMPTNGLRWLQSSRDDAHPPILQQCFLNTTTGEQVWATVPTVYEDPAAAIGQQEGE